MIVGRAARRRVGIVALLLGGLSLGACGGGGNGGDHGGEGADLPSNGSPTTGDANANIFFLHHSVGGALITEGDVRREISDFNSANKTSFRFWDQGYNGDGLRGPDGSPTGTSHQIPDDNTDVEGLHMLWTSPDASWAASRQIILASYRVIAFKSCFPNSAIADGHQLAQYQEWYLAMRAVFDGHPDRRFVVMPPPPLHRLATNATEAGNARAFATWLCSPSYLEGRANVSCFNLFDQLAAPGSGSSDANCLRYEYELAHSDGDSHPNALANVTVGPAMARFFCQVAAH